MTDEELDLQRLGSAITRLREQKGWTTHYLAKVAGVSDPYVSRIERGDGNRVGIGILDRIARALRVDLDEVFREAGAVPEIPLPRELRGVYRELGPPERRVLLDTARSLRDLKAWYRPEMEPTEGPLARPNEELGDIGLNRPAAYDRKLKPPEDEDDPVPEPLDVEPLAAASGGDIERARRLQREAKERGEVPDEEDE